MAMSMSEIIQKWSADGYKYHEDIPHKVEPDHIFDVDKTVRENREMAVAFNQDVEVRTKAARTKRSVMYAQFTQDVVEYLMSTYKFSEKQAQKVENYVYTEMHSSMCDYFNAIDEIAGLISAVITM